MATLFSAKNRNLTLRKMASKKLWTTYEVLTRSMILAEDTDLIGALFREAHHFRLLPA